MQFPTTQLAAALAEWTDPALSAVLDCDEITAARLRFCSPPRPTAWVSDVARLAAALEIDAKRLEHILCVMAPKERR